jgi:peptide/nickel transport system substrate-binding protein
MWINKIFAAFTKKERIIFIIALAGAVLSFLIVIGIIIAQITKAVPTAGGEYIEGIVGQPEYVNPVIASSETDLDLVHLVYNNLSDLADSVTPSPDMRTWTVRIKDGLVWQDGQKLTADDVIFTVQSIQDKDANSPLYASWQGVQVNRDSELEVQFTLNAPYSFFGNNLKNLYILPKHIYGDTPPGNWRLSDYNLKPVGSGPYRFNSYGKGADGFISSYNLTAWDGTSGPHPLIGNFDFKFFNDENDLVQSFNNGQIDGFGDLSPSNLAEIDRPYHLFSWRTSSYYAVFLNQSKNLALQDPAVREALSVAVDRSTLVGQVFGLNSNNGASNGSTAGAVPDYGPIPPDAAYYAAPASSTISSGAASAESLLDNAGWTMSSSTGFRAKTIHGSVIPLTINLTVPQIDFLTNTANQLRAAWQAIGVQANITVDSPGNIAANEIKNRSYEALLFGNALGASSDLYSFWDSSQRFSPGLNLAILGDSTVDSPIEAARQTSSTVVTASNLAQAQTEIESDYPAVFLYSPDYLYAAGANVLGVTTTDLLTDPSDRFLDVTGWYLNTARVLK